MDEPRQGVLGRRESDGTDKDDAVVWSPIRKTIKLAVDENNG